MTVKHMANFVIKPVLTLALVGTLGFLSGCASTEESGSTTKAAPSSSSRIPALPAGVTLHSEGKMQGIWLAEGFKPKNYDSLEILPTTFVAVERENEVDMRTMAMRFLPEQLSAELRTANAFTNIVTPGQTPASGGKVLKLQTTIIEYEQGGAVGRIFAGPLGGGQPVIKVRGQFLEGDKPVCVFELKRSGESDEDKFLGGGKSNEEIQRNDIHVLAKDLGNFLQTVNSR